MIKQNINTDTKSWDILTCKNNYLKYLILLMIKNYE